MFGRKKYKQKSYDPAVDTGKSTPIRVRVVPRDANDRYSGYPSNGLNPIRLAAIFREADNGNVSRQMELFEEIEEKDTHLFSQLQTRKLAVTGLEWEVQPFSKDTADKEIAEFVEGQLQGMEGLNGVFLDMLDAIGKGISILELIWGVDRDGNNVIEDITWIHPKKLVWDMVTDEMLICTKEYPAGIPVPDNKFIVHRYKAKSGHPSRAGVMRIVSWMYLFKNFDIKDWVAFCEVFGMPLRLGKYDASASEDDKRTLEEAIFSLGTDAAGVVPSTTDVQFIEAQKTSSTEIYEKFARFADEQMSKAILGQTLTSDSGGSYAQGRVHSEVKKDLTKADAKALAETFRRDVITPLVEYNFGSNANIPLFEFELQDDDDLKETAETYKILSCDMGLKIPASHVRKKFSIPAPKDGEEVLEPVGLSGADAIENMDMEEKSLKADIGKEGQIQIEQMVRAAAAQSEKIFGEMFQPLLDLIDRADSLETLRLSLKDTATLGQIYGDMNTGSLEDVARQGMYLAELIGRTVK